MKNIFLFSVVGSVFVLSAWAEQPRPKWNQTMQKLYGELSTILTDVSSDERWTDPKRQAELRKSVDALAKAAHDLNRKDVTSPDRDPSVIIFGKLFDDEAKYASRILKSGSKTYARELLRNMAGYCIACHTRTNSGPSFTSVPINPTAQKLKPIERGEFFAASRQYDRAMAEFDQVLADERAPKAHPLEWARAVKYSLAVAVRVKRDPSLAKATIERIVEAPDAPFFLKQNALKWRESVREWQNETQHKAVTEDGLYAEAVRLLAKAHEAQRYPADHSADIYYLRASAAVHDLLQVGAQGRHAGEAYLMAGMCYDVLRSFHVGELHEIYYEACIRNNAHSTLAESCFQRFQEAAFEGFTGSGGTNLPDDLKDKLKALEEMSKVKPAPAQAFRD